MKIKKERQKGRYKIKNTVAAIVILGAIVILCIYILLQLILGFSYCIEIAYDKPRLIVASAVSIVLFCMAFFYEKRRILRIIFLSTSILIALVILPSIFCYLGGESKYQEGKAIKEQRAAAANIEQGEISQDKLRDVVAENVARLEELKNLKERVPSSGQDSVVTETIVIENYTNGALGGASLGGVQCVDDEIMIYDGGWLCASIEDILDENDITSEGIDTDIVNTVSGNKIGTYTNESGTIYDINESVTALSDNGNGSFSYTNEQGTLFTISASSLETLTALTISSDGHSLSYLDEDGTITTIDIQNLETTTTLTDNTDGTFTYVNEDGGVGITVDHKDFDYNATTVTYADGKLQCLTDSHILQWDGINTQWDCVSLDSIDGSVVVTDNTDGTFSVAVTDPGGAITTTTVDHKDMSVDGTTAVYADGKISCANKGDVLAFGGADWSCVTPDKLITHSELRDDADGTFTHISGSSVSTTVDTKDLVYDVSSVSYIDGKVQCIKDNFVLLWKGSEWVCVDPTTDLNVVTTLIDNPTGTVTYTSEDNTVTTFDHKDFVFDATTMTYADGKVACLLGDQVMVWDTTNAQWTCQAVNTLETVTTLTDDAAGTFTYKSEDGTTTTTDHRDFTYDALTISYADGKISCLSDGYILSWDDVAVQWSCVANEVGEVCDGDDDTCVYVNEGDADFDDIRFVLDGAEHFRMSGSTLAGDRRATLEVLNSGESVFLGERAGWVDNYSSNKNTFLGYYAGTTNTTGDENTFVGHQVGLTNTTGYDNAFFGKNAGQANTTGYQNTFLGHTAGFSNSTGRYNTLIGHESGRSNTTGLANTLVGREAGEGITTGQYNSILGYQAGQLNTVGIGNVFMGREAGSNGLGGNYNIGIGYRASDDVTTGGVYNNSIGFAAGEGLTVQDYNNFIGYYAGRNVSGDTNNAVYLGTRAGEDSSGGTANIGIGFESAEGITGGTYNSYIGFRAGEVADGGNQNSFFGSHAGRNAQSGLYNMALGYYAGDNLAVGIGNSMLGYTAGRNLAGGNYNTYIGYQSGHDASGGSHNQALGYRAARNITGGNGNLMLGYNAGYAASGGNYSSYIGRNAGQNAAGGTDNTAIGLESAQNLQTGTQNTFVGSYSGEDFNGGNYNSGLGRYTFSRATGGSYNVALGEQAARDISGGSYNLMGGYQAGYSLAGGAHNVMLGYRAGRQMQAGNYNNIIGRDAGYSIVNATDNNIFGSYSGQNLDGGNYNVFSGFAAGRYTTSGDDNVFIGRSAGQDATTAIQNIAIGYVAGQNFTTSLRNIAIGQNASGLTTTGNENIAIGYQAGYRNTTGNNNLFLGRQAGRGSNVTGSNNVFIGNRAGYSEAGSNKLYIEGGGGQYTPTNSLIYGEFDNDLLRLNADVGIGTSTPAERLHVIGNILATGTITPSDQEFKENIEQVESALEQLLEIRGTTYDYKDSPLIGTQNIEKGQYGVIAQEVEKVFPNLVEHYDFDGDGEKDYKAVNYTGLTPVMIEAIRELSDTNKKQGKDIDQLIEINQEKNNEDDSVITTIEEDAIISVEENPSFLAELVGDIWQISEEVVYQLGAVFEGAVAFLGKVTFMDRITYVDEDMAGNAIIKKDHQSISIQFKQAFADIPVVQITNIDHHETPALKDISREGFEIGLNKKAEEDLIFTWLALAHTNTITTTSESQANIIEEEDLGIDEVGSVENGDSQDKALIGIDQESADTTGNQNQETSDEDILTDSEKSINDETSPDILVELYEDTSEEISNPVDLVDNLNEDLIDNQINEYIVSVDIEEEISEEQGQSTGVNLDEFELSPQDQEIKNHGDDQGLDGGLVVEHSESKIETTQKEE